jgi:hypothetical protein
MLRADVRGFINADKLSSLESRLLEDKAIDISCTIMR